MQSFLFYGFPQIFNVKVVLKSSQNLVISNILSIFAPRKKQHIGLTIKKKENYEYENVFGQKFRM